MAKTIDLTTQVNQLLKEYGDEVNKVVDEVLPQVAKETVEMLKATSPRRTGKYARSWLIQNWKNSQHYTGVTIHNSRGELTHLLEFGHAKQNGGRVQAEPHIDPANEFAQNKLVNLVSTKIRGIQ